VSTRCLSMRSIFGSSTSDPALKARCSTAQGGAQRNPGKQVRIKTKPCKGGTSTVSPLQGLFPFRFDTQGSGCFAALPWAVLSRAFGAQGSTSLRLRHSGLYCTASSALWAVLHCAFGAMKTACIFCPLIEYIIYTAYNCLLFNNMSDRWAIAGINALLNVYGSYACARYYKEPLYA
jgi:hypothetical protein